MPRIILCPDCAEQKEHWAKGLCKKCYGRQQRAAYYQRHRQRLDAYKLKWQKQRRQEIRQWLADFKANQTCKLCGYNDPICLVFHHRNPEDKEFSLACAVAAKWSKKHIFAEIEKCDVLCSNCHIKLHHRERNLTMETL